ncbi:guanitoxin biosynthesis L-enduracididine beta-hydroxylase GntD [Streptomyces sp. NPDC048483]|uniref:guanitoxin biosynthesis L-enduracididine beta-hydroxylase GntD n=1 Tax=Streptomyces sp. NPDC048483 TaxID=3154927 RepID=UPI00342C5F81
MQQLDAPAVYDLDAGERCELDELLDDMARDPLTPGAADPGSEAFYREGKELTTRLPTGLRRFLYTFRTTEPSAAARIRGLPVDDAALGPTPAHWRAAAASPAGRREEAYLALVGLAMGEPFTWSTLQQGRMIQNVLPIAGEEAEQNGHGQVQLEWHTEDGFHPYRCDHLLLMGMRNNDAIGTTLASIRDVRLSAEYRAILAGERFHILPDDEHLRQPAALDPHHPGLARMRRMRDEPEPVAVLFGAQDSPYLRIDPCYMRCLPGDADAELALKYLIGELDRVQQTVAVDPGEILLVDNYRAVHGRQSFRARFDGTDRWLKKITVTADLRRSRDQRAHAGSRVIL